MAKVLIVKIQFLSLHIKVSGLSGSTSTAQEQVSVGMGLLAGSTTMLLTLVWGSCVLIGKCDIENGVAVDSKDTKGFHITRMYSFCYYDV